MRCLSFFYYFAKEPMGISGRISSCVRGQSRALTVWSAGSFARREQRIIWHQLGPHGSFIGNIDLPTIRELAGWKDLLPLSFFIDKEGNPVYGTERSKKMYQQSLTKAGLREVKSNENIQRQVS